MPLTISPTTHRRFILGRQGLWPGRRWSGIEGTALALAECEALQLDPLNIIARSHEIALYGRVLDFRPTYLDELCYKQRRFFDYGGALFVYPMSELPYWHLAMQRAEHSPRWEKFQHDHPDTTTAVLQALHESGPLGNRDFKGNHRVNSYRGSKDTSVCLYYLWLIGKVMVHHRENFQRIYDLRQRIAPPEFDYAVSQAEAEAYFARKAIAFAGLVRQNPWANNLAYYLNCRLTKSESQAWLDGLVAAGEVLPVQVDGEKENRYMLAADLPTLETLQAGGIPPTWQPLETTTLDEVTFLAPLEICTARRRAAKLFDFDYVWEVYKPVDQRRWGYYVLPILYGDRLVARMDSRMDRPNAALRILEFWPEDHCPVDDPAFARAFALGLQRFMDFLGAQSVDLPASLPQNMRLAVHNKH